MPRTFLTSLPTPYKLSLSIVTGLFCWYMVRHYSIFEQMLIYSGIAQFITTSLQVITKLALSIFGISSDIENYTLHIYGSRGMNIIYGCLAISHIALFIGLIIAFPGKWKTKLWYIPAGILTLHVLNALRLVLIGIILVYAPSWDEIAHYWFTRIILYSGVLGLWLFYILHLEKPLK